MAQGLHSSHVPCACVSVVLIVVSPRHLHSLLPHLHLSDHPVLPTARQLQLPRCGGPIHPLRTLAPWPRRTPPQVMSPTTTSLQRRMSSTPRSPRASNILPMTSTTMTSPSARRSLTRAEDEPITLTEEGLSSCLSSSVSHDRTGRPVDCSLGSQVSSAQETQRHISESEQIRTLLERQKKSRFSLTVKQRFENTNSRPITTEEVFKN